MKIDNEKKISSGMLHLIAMAAMLIDHIGAMVLSFIMESQKLSGGISADIFISYKVCRCIGRFALPIFAFLLSEGFQHTSDKKKYAFRLLVMAIISEIPFDLAVSHKLIDFSYQNTMFTLFISMLMLIAMSKVEGKCRFPLPEIVICAAAACICYLLKTDYAVLAPILVAIFYIFRDKNELRFLLAAAAVILIGKSVTKFFGLLPLILIYFCYDGTKGKSSKILNYTFYPAHMLLLYAVCMAII